VEATRTHKLLIGTGGGTRARHVYALAAELGMPTGVLSEVGAAVAGCKQMIFVKDEDGLYSANPKNDASATFIPRATVDELIEMDLPDLVIERPVLELMRHARHVREVQIVNGLRPGMVLRALQGEHVGSIITAA
jgi:uridylate kinase